MIGKYVLFAVFLLCYASGIDNEGEAELTWVYMLCSLSMEQEVLLLHRLTRMVEHFERRVGGLPSNLLVVYNRDGVLYAPICLFLFLFYRDTIGSSEYSNSEDRGLNISFFVCVVELFVAALCPEKK